MNEEIKEKLEAIASDDDVDLSWNEADDLLNYITNLQEENNLLKTKIKCMEEKINYKNAYKDENEIYNEFFK